LDIILGIDPGTQVTGYALLKIANNRMSLVAVGTIFMEKYDDHYDRLSCIYDRVTELIKNYKPNILAIEAPFFGKNVQSMLKLGRAQGVAMAAALSYKLPVIEYSPRKIKQSITGNGNASKEQVAAMLAQLLKEEKLPTQLDATDALAVAVCHHFQTSSHLLPAGKSYKGWEAFIKDNPKRIQ